MSIKDDLYEIESINKELGLLRQKIKDLNKRKKECETNVVQYLEVNNYPGVKYNGVIVQRITKEYRKHPTKKQKMENGLKALHQLGIGDEQTGAHILQTLMESLRGPTEVQQTLKIS